MTDETAIIVRRIASLEKLLEQVAQVAIRPRVPVPLREAAEFCHVELEWLRDRVERREIPAFRPGPRTLWRVHVDDVVKFLTADTNLKPQRRLRQVI